MLCQLWELGKSVMANKLRTITLEGKKWRLASIHGGIIKWAWLVNVKHPMEQVRFSYSEFERLED